MASPKPNPQQVRDEATVLLLRSLFHGKFCPDEKVEDDAKGLVLPTYFCGWLDHNMPLMDPATECEAAGVGTDVWEFVRSVLDSGVAVERFAKIWYVVCLGHRPTPKHALEKIVLNMVLHWSDGVIIPIQVFVSAVMLEEGQKFNDGVVASIVSKNCLAFTQAVVTQGLDGMHDGGKNYRGDTPEDPFEVMMGLLIKLGIPKVRPELQKPVEDYMRLAQGMIRPVIPPEVMAALEAKKRQWQAQRRRQGQIDQVRGGWDS
jgi:hypothetical protein